MANNNEPTSATTQAASDYILYDCATIFDSPASATLTGLDYLDGMTVSVSRDGVLLPGPYVVHNGQITVDQVPAKNCIVGLPYAGMIQTFPFESADRSGAALGRKKLSFKLMLRMLNSLGGQYGSCFDDMRDIDYANPIADEQRPLFNGVKELSWSDSDTELSVCVQSTPGLPLTVSALSLKMEVEEG